MSSKIRKYFIITLALLTLNISVLPACVFANNIEQKKKDTSAKIQKLKMLENMERNKLYKNQQKLESATSTLAVSQTQLNSVESQLSQMERELINAMNEYSAANDAMQGRIRKVFKKQRKGMFQMILLAKDLNSLLDVIYFEKIILKRDYEKVTKIKTKSQQIAKMKNDVEARKRYLAQSIKSIDSQKQNIKTAIARNQTMIDKLKTDRAYYERSERELAKQSQNIQTMISKNKNDTVVASSGAFIKPIAGRISSPFGWRTHPIFNSRTFHSGIDIAGPNLGSIKAANSGKVIFTGWYGGYGKVVIIDHGKINGAPITTLYAHLSSIKASNGQYVNQGDVIGYEGTTGYSTGPHCHFEVRVDGKPNNPLNYI